MEVFWRLFHIHFGPIACHTGRGFIPQHIAWAKADLGEMWKHVTRLWARQNLCLMINDFIQLLIATKGDKVCGGVLSIMIRIS